MGSYKPRHLKQEQSVVSSIVSRRGLAVAAATATVVPVALSESASAAPAPAAVASPAKAAPIKAAGAYNVSYGARGYWVELLQYRLQRKGYAIAKDRSYGPQTLWAVKAVQRRAGIYANGYVGDSTWRALGGVPGGGYVSRSAPRTSTSGSSIVRIAQQYHGVPYVWGGTTPNGFDCSGLTQYVYRKAGKSIPRTASAQQAGARRVYSPVPGDLVFSGFPAYHVSIYAGNGYEVSARMPGTSIVTKKIWGYKNYGRY
ncbi:hypothetical protein GCM10027599_07600 [Yimella radicis]